MSDQFVKLEAFFGQSICTGESYETLCQRSREKFSRKIKEMQTPNSHEFSSFDLSDKQLMKPVWKRTGQNTNLQSTNSSRSEALWLHLHMPQFPLEVLTRGVASHRACVLVTGEGSGRYISMANTRAATCGMRSGMLLSAARALGDLTVLARNQQAERQALDKLCLWAMHLSSHVSPVPPDGLVLEIRGSLRLFRGMEGLLFHLRQGLRALGYRIQYAVAPTPLAATLLARANARANVFTKQDLTRHLSPLPIETLRLEKHHNEALTSIGVGCIGDSRRLPRIGLARRFSPMLNAILDRYFG